jgi:hypothetical protein
MKSFLEKKLILWFKLVIIFINILIKMIELFRLKSKLKILLCTVAKDENKYILEFIHHYRNMNVSKIIIYDNNEINGENFLDILKDYIEINFIKIINIRGFQRPQKIAYHHCYKYNKYNYEWIAFFDIDEFLFLLNYTFINDFLSSNVFNNCQSIIINWKYYGDNDKLYYEEKPLRERFIKPVNITEEIVKIGYIYSAAKTIVRGGLELIWGHFPHYFKNTVNCRPNGNILEDYLSPPDYSNAYIKHYTTKSTEEFIERLNKGDVYNKPDIYYLTYKIKEYYFLFNKINKEKIELIKNKLKYKINISLDNYNISLSPY